MRAAPALAALLLVCAAVAGAGAAGGPDALPTTEPGEPGAVADERASDVDHPAPNAARPAANAANVSGANRVLGLPNGSASSADIDQVRLDAGVAVGIDVNVSAERMETIALRQHVTAAETTDERQRRILDGMNELEKRVVTLRTEQRIAISAYAAGEIDARTLYVRLASVQVEAEALERRLDTLDQLADGTEDGILEGSRVEALRYDLRTFGGPVRERATLAIRGDAPPTRVYAAASGESVVLTTVVEDEYVREVYRADLRPNGGGPADEIAQNVTARSYPEIWDVQTNANGQGSGPTFVFDVPFPGGRLTAFVDGGSERVFKEYQRIDLGNVSTGDVRERTIDLTIRVNRTYAGGPLRVEVVDPDSGEPVDAAVRIARSGEGSSEIGTTGADGVLWTVAPRGTFVVTAIDEHSEDLATIELTSGDPLTVEDAYAPNGTENGS
ncbi:DUF7096 domain-containing protein [Halorarum salinum]|uniref:Uncharacterized protein n=1 Tax=Halorarum salinum TaxID=2743089 RepID=A0A7D5LCC9_9EURY|nr:hypothetical protein [Halobaculum salinum]QLG63546.1 hypothetical protein HUG12_18155 [Halobaculum salinum]